MIKISYQNTPQKYLDLIDRFKGKIQKWYDKGAIGNGDTKIALCPECKSIFEMLLWGDNLKKLLLFPAEKLPNLIAHIEKRYPVLQNERLNKPNPHSALYECLMKAFYSLGYCDHKFPSFEITQALGVNACPYCNAEEIIIQDLKDVGKKIHSSQLDHFYPKELFPYLAICLHNLVPSGSICNGGHCKHNKDSYQFNMVNPFSLDDSEGFVFELNLIKPGILSYDKFEQSCSIVTHIANNSLAINATTFLIKSRYEQEIQQAKKVWFTHQKYSPEGYEKEIERISRKLNTPLTFDDCLEIELGISLNDYNKHKLSKLSMDIWRQLESRPIP